MQLNLVVVDLRLYYTVDSVDCTNWSMNVIKGVRHCHNLKDGNTKKYTNKGIGMIKSKKGRTYIHYFFLTNLCSNVGWLIVYHPSISQL